MNSINSNEKKKVQKEKEVKNVSIKMKDLEVKLEDEIIR